VRWAHLRSGVTVACPRRLFAYWKKALFIQ
jgi:hypothetical protein